MCLNDNHIICILLLTTKSHQRRHYPGTPGGCRFIFSEGLEEYHIKDTHTINGRKHHAASRRGSHDDP